MKYIHEIVITLSTVKILNRRVLLKYKDHLPYLQKDVYEKQYLLVALSWLASGRVSTRPERMCVFPLRPGLLSEKTA